MIPLTKKHLNTVRQIQTASKNQLNFEGPNFAQNFDLAKSVKKSNGEPSKLVKKNNLDAFGGAKFFGFKILQPQNWSKIIV